ncbi:MAG: peptide-methionine (S)-S-oxide reductase MsrA [Pirellulaceae bacterium]
MSEPQQATFGGGCFWCTEAVFRRIRGVSSVVSGYCGGQIASPTYEAVCQGTTGHAEVIQVEFDSQQISFGDLLDVFFATHDPSTLNQQGADRGTQYRSVIFYHDEIQKQIADEKVNEWNSFGEYPNPVVTEIVPIATFFPAEVYHQEYFERNSHQPYCSAVIAPKVQKLLERFADLTRHPS